MDWETFRQWMVPIAVVVNAIATLAGFWIASIRFRRQSHAAVFMEYTRRFQDLFSQFPTEFRMVRISDCRDLPPSTPEATDIADRLVALISQEFYLHQNGYLGRDVWRYWEPSLRFMLASPFLRREWESINHRYTVYPDFHAFVVDCQRVGQAGDESTGTGADDDETMPEDQQASEPSAASKSPRPAL